MKTTTSTRNPPTLGTCPVCETEIASYDVSLEFEPPGDEPTLYAECPDCREVVNPE